MSHLSGTVITLLMLMSVIYKFSGTITLNCIYLSSTKVDSYRCCFLKTISACCDRKYKPARLCSDPGSTLWQHLTTGTALRGRTGCCGPCLLE